MPTSRMFLAPSVATLPFSLAACGGGEGAPANPTAPQAHAPVPTPTPAPTPTPTPGPAVTEFDRSGGLAQINAQSAVNAGLFGAGQKVALIDTGVDFTNPEFAGRIDAASADMIQPITRPDGTVAFGDRGTSATRGDTDGHGTRVASIIAAARNSSGIQGVAPAATILSLRSDSDTRNAGNLSTTAIARGLDAAVSAGARVINMSLGSTSGPALNPVVPTYGALTRAGQAGAVIVMAAGNESASEVSGLAATGLLPQVARANSLVVGAVDSRNVIADFSNRAGAAQERYLVAPGYVTATVLGGNGAVDVAQGTSFATPYVSGAALVLMERWPTLPGSTIAQILLDSATDLGAPGTDAVYGRGLLNLEAALQAKGTASVQTATGLISIGTATSLAGASLTLPAALGDAGAGLGAAAGFTYLDGYGRDFGFALAGRVQSTPTPLTVAGALDAPLTGSMIANRTGASLSSFTAPQSGLRSTAPAAAFNLRLGKTALALSTGMSDAELAPLAAFGFDSQASKVAASHQVFAGGTLRFAMSHAAAQPAPRGEPKGSSDMMSLAYAHTLRVAGHPLALGLTAMTGGQSRAAVSSNVLDVGNDSRFEALLLTGQTSLAGITFDGRWLMGQQRFSTTTSQLLGLAPVRLTGWSLAATGQLLRTNWQLSVSQPVRGTSTLLTFEDTHYALAPSGNERRIEAGLLRHIGSWQLSANAVQRFDAGHVSGAQDQAAWLRLSTDW
jgi:subtilisin family serine protease